MVMALVLELRGGRRHGREGVRVLLGGGRHIPPRLKVAQAAAWSPWWGVWSLLLQLLLLGGEASGVEAGLVGVVVVVVVVRGHGRFLLHGKGATRHAVDLLELWVWVGRGVAVWCVSE